MAVGHLMLKERARFALSLAPAVVVAVGFLKTSKFEAVTAPAQMLDILLALASWATIVGLLLTLVLPAPSSPLRSQKPWRERLRPSPVPGGEAVMALAVSAGFLLSLSIVLACFAYFYRSGFAARPMAWVAVAALGVGGSLIGARPLRRQRPTWLPSAKVGLLAILTPAVLLSLLQFWVQHSYTPTRLATSITIERELLFQRSQDGTRNQGTADFTYRNEGETPTTLVISGFLKCFRDTHTGRTRVEVGDPACEQGSRPIAARSRVEAESTLAHRDIFTWEEGTVVVESLARVAYARADRLRMGPRIDPTPVCSDSLPETAEKRAVRIDNAYPLFPASRYRSLVSVPRILAYGPGDRGGETYWITNANDPSCIRDDDLLIDFGIAEMSVYFREWIPALDGPDLDGDDD